MLTKLVVGLFCGAVLLSSVACAASAAPAPSGKYEAIIAAVETEIAASVDASLAATLQALPTAVPMATPSPDAPQVACRLWLTATVDVPFREGPGTDYPPMGQMLAGQSAEVLNHDGYYSWWLVPLIDGRKAWVPGAAVRLSDCANYPPALSPPPSTGVEPRSAVLWPV